MAQLTDGKANTRLHNQTFPSNPTTNMLDLSFFFFFMFYVPVAFDQSKAVRNPTEPQLLS
uniref:Uncharacterized protein n=1 Tax=Arundo donax TaxID=35708 RepID=A0A0A8Y481_ARUDO